MHVVEQRQEIYTQSIIQVSRGPELAIGQENLNGL